MLSELQAPACLVVRPSVVIVHEILFVLVVITCLYEPLDNMPYDVGLLIWHEFASLSR